MPTVNEALQDAQISHAVDLQQYTNGVVRRIVALLNRADASLSAALSEALSRLDPDSFTVARLETLLTSVRQINAQAYAQVQAELEGDLRDLADYEAGWQFDLFERVLPEPVKVRYPLVRITAEQVYAATMARPFQGRLLREWAQGLDEGRMRTIREAVRQGFVQGQTVDQIVRAIRGSRAEQYADGLLNRSRNDLVTIVHTAIGHTAAVARENFYSANSVIVKAEKWTSTLDTKTSEPCRIRDNLRYEAGTHKPIGHKVPWLQGPGRIHMRCRSTSTPVTKSWRELGIPVDEMSPGERASMDGQVPADTTYAEWLQRQSYERQEQVLGVDRARMMQEGATLDTFYDSRGRWLTLDELRERDSVRQAA